MKTLHFLAVVVLITGCASTSKEALETYTDLKLCNVYAFNKDNSAVRAEIDRRGLLTADEHDVIQHALIYPGMSECALVASWSYPVPFEFNMLNMTYCGSVIKSVGVWGTSKQYVYRSCMSSIKTGYVNVEAGKVTSWQE